MSEFTSYANSFQTVINLSLGRISALLDMSGNPQDRCRCVHVGGTNGKGSVCAFLEAMLRAAGYRVGKYTSPNLIRVNERIAVDGEPISDAELAPLLEKIGERCLKVRETLGEMPSQFEVWTAAAFEYFAAKACDVVLLEVGMGGEFDATNVIKSNLAAVLTRIDLDHCAYLGNTVEEIARTKSGIIKPGCPVVTVRQAPGVNRVIAETAAEKGGALTVAEIPEPTEFEGIYEFMRCKGRRLRLGLGGPHQLENAALAVKTAEALGLDSADICRGIETARHPARLEMLAPGLIFDGAHNPNGVGALVRALDRYFPEGGQTVVFACMGDKEILPSLKMLGSPRRSFIFTQVNGNPRAMAAETLRAKAREAGIEGAVAPDLTAAVKMARDIGNLTVICGSLYLYETVPEAVGR